MNYATDQESLERDCEMQFFRGSGPGGQNRNKTETGVRLSHIPSGIVVEAEDERSQAQNRKHAFERLRKRLQALNRPRKRRVATNPPLRAKEERLHRKRAHSRAKQERQSPPVEP